MPKKPDRPRELESLGKKVREASDVISRLRDTNRALATELEAMKIRLAEGGSSPKANLAASGSKPAAELALLRQEREQIRDRIVHLLEQLEEISSPPPAAE
jgi:chromosome segregation ATPase